MKAFILLVVLLSASYALGRSPPLCREGSTWSDGCNTCNCRNGLPLCTKIFCPPGSDLFSRNRYRRSTEEVSSNPQCLENSEWSDGCNTCFCNKGGVPLCTRKLCPPGFPQEASPSTCTEGSKFMRDCNLCECVGGVAVCTEKACVAEPDTAVNRVPESEKQCENFGDAPGRWRVDCNWCTCSDAGIGMCTLMACFGGRDTSETECEGDLSWKKDDCNWCSCVDGRGVCTKKACYNRDEFPALNKKPETTSTTAAPLFEKDCELVGNQQGRWRNDCNWCSCTEAGLSFCTLIGCFGERDESEPECEGEIRWKDDCNWCSCVDGRGVCTRRACFNRDEFPALNKPATTSAVVPARADANVDETAPVADSEADCTVTDPSTDRWRNQCNWCRCLNGRSACTKRGCPTDFAERYADEPECEGNALWSDDCNQCRCNNGRAVCTRKACPPKQVTPNTSVSSSFPSPSSECKPASSWQDGCNTCRCSETGLALCTRKACARSVGSSQLPRCSAGSVWKKGCNTCTCNESGYGICTAKACATRNEMQSTPPPTPEDGACEEGSSFSIDCNSCMCVNGLAVCTRMACPSFTQVPDDLKCVEGTTWHDDCNICICESGFASCTRKLCIDFGDDNDEEVDTAAEPEPLEEVELPSLEVPVLAEQEKTCIAEGSFNLECNICHCSNNAVVCTFKACLNKPGEPKTCSGKARWKDGCNWCECIDGFQSCTKMHCFSEISTSLANSPDAQSVTVPTLNEAEECAGTSHWRRDCNWCNCNGGKAVCTRRACVPASYRESSDCSAGSVWKDDCNTCTCSEDGYSQCTKKLCVGNKPQPPTDEDVDCTPGSQWKDGCNTCSCTSTGLRVCTRKLCTDSSPAANTTYEGDCLSGSYYKHSDGCNTCYCHEGTAACSAKLCVTRPKPAVNPAIMPTVGRVAMVSPAIRRVSVISPARTDASSNDQNTEAECQEGKQWLQDCNICLCNGGKALCTTRACISNSTSGTQQQMESNEERCSKPAQSGPCFAAFRKFKFSVEHNRCEMFLYGGCGGNTNRFSTAEECEETCGGEAPVIDSQCNRLMCSSHQRDVLMKAKGCKVLFEGGSCCSTGYDCSQPEEQPSNPTSCLFRGTEVEDGERLPLTDSCNICSCFGGRIECAHVDCPFPPVESNCRRIFDLDTCCSTGLKCHAANEKQTPMCSYKGKDYFQGDQMYFSGQDASRRCICGSGFSGPYGQGCREIDCGYDTHAADRLARGCVPRYYKQKWCPIGYICPESNTEISAEQDSLIDENAADTSSVCTFGDLTISVGRSLRTTIDNLKCECIVPPMVTCREL